MKSITNALASTRYVIFEKDQVLYVFTGLGLEYDWFIVFITLQYEICHMKDISMLLLAHESILE